MNIWILDDDEAMCSLLSRQSQKLDWTIQALHHPRQLPQALQEGRPDLLLLDQLLPEKHGLDVLAALQQAGRAFPVMILSALGAPSDRIAGLEAGADDYLVKPFSPRTLVARVRAVLRRRSPQSLDDAVQMGPLKLDPSTRRVTCLTAGVPVEIRLGPTEFRLLHYLLTHPERVHSRAQLLDRVWGDHVFIEERTVDVHIKRLRESLSVADCSGMVETVRGAGYRLAALPQAVTG
jgi:two-component system phosphate regulon response regulator PhoB